MIYSYIVKWDSGFAPNPFWGTMTLNTCKPGIRKSAKTEKEEKDWIIGTGSKKTRCLDGKLRDYSGKLIFAMKVSTVITMLEYDELCNSDDSFKNKIPDWDNEDIRRKNGDCIYNFLNYEDRFILESQHCNNGKSKEEIFNCIRKDLSGINTLLSNDFYYFGNAPIDFQDFKNLTYTTQNFKKITNTGYIDEFEAWIRKKERFDESKYNWLKNNNNEKRNDGCN